MTFFTLHTARIRKKTEKRLDAYSHPTANFFVLISLASAIAALGLMQNNSAVIIGAMVVAPLVTPVFGLSLSLLVFKIKHAGVSILLIFLGTVLAIFVSTVIGRLIFFIYGEGLVLNNEIIQRTKPDLLFFLVALFSGMAGAYAYSRPKILESITGIAISVAIIPPLAVSGLGIAARNFLLSQQSLFFYLLNLFGIIFGSVLMFLFLGFAKEHKRV